MGGGRFIGIEIVGVFCCSEDCLAGPVPSRARTAEAALNGMPVGEAAIAAIGEEVLKDVNPRTSWRATAEFRKQIISETARRGLKAAIERAGGVF